ncbi:hypothetical protein GIB67_039822 [Kingdonia uniflora]|uniref:Uncharacterized protein n=1 Tax=Kingdonia uniflora TaxID=39325 RepID=A0A7J7P362_9MAGN|nr:hypothetical protein GIB67_039822 [Kingdonia uniflora]
MKFPYPGALTTFQYFTSATRVLLCGQFRVLAHDPLDLRIMWQFLPVAIIFYLSLFTNNELFLHANVDTFIVFLSAVPIFVAIGEALYLHQSWPSFREPLIHSLRLLKCANLLLTFCYPQGIWATWVRAHLLRVRKWLLKRSRIVGILGSGLTS